MDQGIVSADMRNADVLLDAQGLLGEKMKSRVDGDGKALRVRSVPHLADQDDGYAGFDSLSAATCFAQDLWSAGGMNSVTIAKRSRVAGRTVWEAVLSLPGA